MKHPKIGSFLRYKWFIFLIVLATLCPYIANDVPIIAKKDGALVLPISTNLVRTITNQSVYTAAQFDASTIILNPPIPYKANSIDLDHINQAPSLSNGHLLGTEKLGKDILAILLYGLRYALFIGFGVTLVASILGISLGILAGYFGNHRLRLTKFQLVLLGLFLLTILYIFILPQLSFAPKLLIIAGLAAGCWMVSKWIVKEKTGTIRIPVDKIVVRLVEWTEAIPGLILIFVLAAFFAPNSLFDLVLIVGLLNWQQITKFVRAETLQLRQAPYISVAEKAGLPWYSIASIHLLPKVLTNAKVQLLYVMAGAILIESVLSFLSIGTDPSTMTWGKLLNQGMDNVYHWWIIVLPSLCLFALVYTLFGLIFKQSA